MDLQTIEMARPEARKHFLEYRTAVRRRHSDEDEQIMKTYKALSKGQRVIDLRQVISDAGGDSQFRPRLAVARADERRIIMTRYRDGSVHYDPPGWRSDVAQTRRWRFRGINSPVQSTRWIIGTWSAMVPIVPPALRPALDLRGYTVLWEAEWTKAPPRDPALLKPIGGGLYAVLAVWDLTPVERAVLGLTRN